MIAWSELIVLIATVFVILFAAFLGMGIRWVLGQSKPMRECSCDFDPARAHGGERCCGRRCGASGDQG